ncbi:MAG: rhodanese-like domain-containing protein [Planctomycetota bacterium]|jgi:rhodanese-related sulfurtransferase
MNTLGLLVAASSGLIVAATALVSVAISRFRKAGVETDAWELFRRMLRVSSYGTVGAAASQRRLELAQSEMVLVDLRAPGAYTAGHLHGARHRQFDDFRKALVVDREFDKDRHKEIVLICDTGHMSRVAAEIMVEDEGFAHVSSLRGGMKRWHHWEAAQQRRSAWCCGLRSPAACPC